MEAIARNMRPHTASSAEFGNFFKQVVVAVEEKGQVTREGIYIESSINGSLNVCDGIGEREGDLLYSGGAGFAYMVAADADGVPARQVLGAIAEQVGDDAHGVLRWVNVGAARNVLFQDVVLHGTRELAHICSLLFGNGDVEGKQDTSSGIDGHGCADALQRQTCKQCLHILQAGDRDADFANLSLR